MKSIKTLKRIKGKTILLRVDFNVPIKIKEKGKRNRKEEINDYHILDDFRIRKAIPTVKYLVEKGADVLIITHLGKDGSIGLLPIEKRFFKLSHLPQGRVSFFRNIRAFKEEEENNTRFAKKLSRLGDIYVNDAFSVSHRAHASVVGIPKYLPSFSGFQLEKEIQNLSLALKSPRRPFLFILGGAKFSTKIPLIKKYIELADYVFVGGSIANYFLKMKGYEIGKSLVDDEKYNVKNYLKNEKLILPIDVVVALGKKKINKEINEIQKNDTIIDIGEKTTKVLVDLVQRSKIIVWNGPLGKYEDGGDKSTREILRVVAKSKNKSILGGGDTVALVSQMGIEGKFTLVSTGGGATLEFLAKGVLPGIEALG
ncbi:MAG: phosphoglycerate kinase [Candidatus Paceibacterota bacterium]